MKTDKYLYIVRHGQSEGNVDQSKAGTDSPLTEQGLREATQIAGRFSHLPIEIIVSSTMLRAKQTAEIISKRINKEIVFNENAIEKSTSVEERALPYESKERGKFVEMLYDQDDIHYRMSTEETFGEAVIRAKNLLETIENIKEENIALVSHGMFIRVLLGVIFFGEKFSPRDFLQMIRFFTNLKNTGLTVLRFRANDIYTGSGKWRLITWNDHAHLG